MIFNLVRRVLVANRLTVASTSVPDHFACVIDKNLLCCPLAGETVAPDTVSSAITTHQRHQRTFEQQKRHVASGKYRGVS
jgi:hypothetical protein